MGKPKIRFKGYTGDWEQRKLRDLVDIYDGVHQTPEYQDFGIMFLSVENITTLKSEKYISEEAFERDYKVYPVKGDILMTRIGDVGTANVVETTEKVAFYVSLALLKPNEIDSYFLSNAIKTNAFQKGLRERTLVTAIPKKINKDEIGKVDISITNNDEEQQKIGAYFSNLDHLITLHQRKCMEVEYKSLNDWEQRKLGDVFKEYSEKHHDELPALTIIQGGGTILREESDRNLQYDKSNLSGYKMVKKDDFIVHLRSFEGGLEKSNFDGILSPAYHTLHGDSVDSRFYYPYFRSYDFINKKLVAHVYGIRDGRSIDIEGMKTIEIPYTAYEEQKKIGDYLDTLDNIITLHQRKCMEVEYKSLNDWEQRKLGSLLNETREKTKIEDEDILLSCAIDGMYLNSELFSHFRGSSNIGYLKVKKNDLILSAQNLHLGNCNVNLRFEHGIISPAYKVYELVDCNPLFIQAWVKQDSTKDFFLKASTEGASVCRKNIVWEELYNQTLPVPDLKEQEKIGCYFINLDTLITLHQQKYFYFTNITKCIENDIIVYKYHNKNNIIKRDEYKNKTNYSIWKGKDFMGERNSIEVYHGSGEIIYYPEIRKTKYTKDFSWGFYCTKSYEQAKRWAERKHENGIVNVYRYIEDNTLNIKKFDGMTDEWLDFIADCRNGRVHDYDIAEGPMADDTIWNFVNDYLNGNISRTVFWEYARFKHPTHQISFHSIRALNCLEYERSEKIDEEL